MEQFAKGSGMSFDATAFFGNHRSQRYAAIVEDGVVKDIFVEKAPTDITVSSADSVLGKL
jgi:2-Cys peroxiredoxin 5